jgi:predicted RNA-binding Zn ribbon-like protein
MNEPRFEFIGGARVLDFVNTVSWGDGGEERLHEYADFQAWCRAAGLSVGRGRDERAFRKALQLRETLHAMFLWIAFEKTPRERLDPFLDVAMRQLIVRRGQWTLRDPNHPDAPIWWLTWEAANLLTSDAVQSLRRCSNDRCLWLFLDQSRRHNRRWCDMRVCGNREKAKAFYARRKAR